MGSRPLALMHRQLILVKVAGVVLPPTHTTVDVTPRCLMSPDRDISAGVNTLRCRTDRATVNEWARGAQQRRPTRGATGTSGARPLHRDHLTVYQAYPPEIADAAVAAGRFVPPFKRERMTWIKPSFRWMMYRCGWATKPGQERVLAVRDHPRGLRVGARRTRA